MTNAIDPIHNIPPPPPDLPPVKENKNKPVDSSIKQHVKGEQGGPTRLQTFKTSLARFFGIEHFNFKNIRARRAQIQEMKFPLLKRNELAADSHAAMLAVYRRESQHTGMYLGLNTEKQAQYKALGLAVVDIIKQHAGREKAGTQGITQMDANERKQVHDNLTQMDALVGDTEQRDVNRFKERFIEGE